MNLTKGLAINQLRLALYFLIMRRYFTVPEVKPVITILINELSTLISELEERQ